MFKSAMSKGSFIHGLLSFLFTSLEDKKGFHKKLLQIAHSHCAKGVKAVEYGLIGEVSISYTCVTYILPWFSIYTHIIYMYLCILVY